jgi:thiosulfate/3-mercaptopyruvate sulfurtransferase
MTALVLPTPLVSVGWLAAQLEDPELVVLDASMQPVGTGSGSSGAASSGTVEQYIPGARVFDFDQRICDPGSSLPHMLPSPELFTHEVRGLGVNASSRIVVYDRIGIFSSPRAWWMFRAMGHDRVAVLDGGLPAWLHAGLSVDPAPRRVVAPGDFVAAPRLELFVDADHVGRALVDSAVAVLDARSAGRFLGREPEPRPGLRSGHMPNALNLPFGVVQAQGHMRPRQELAAILSAAAGDRQRLIFSCGSGVTACTLALAAEIVGYSNKAVYDGSWSEWGLPSSRPVVSS